MLRGDIDPESTQLSFDGILSSFYAMYQVKSTLSAFGWAKAHLAFKADVT